MKKGETVKALWVKNPWAYMIMQGWKKIEVRSQPTNYRGKVLICSSKKPDIKEINSLENQLSKINQHLGYKGYKRNDTHDSIREGILETLRCKRFDGQALAIATLYWCKPMEKKHEYFTGGIKLIPGHYSWGLKDIKKVVPFETSGKLGIVNYELPQDIEFI